MSVVKKPVPDELTLRALETAAVESWPALEAADVEGWHWRWSSGGSIRGNSVSALHFRGASVEAAIDRIETLYASKGDACVFNITEVDAPRDLDAHLAARGYVRGNDHVTMTKAVEPDATLPDGVAVGVQPTSGWMDVYLSGLSENRRGVAARLIANLPRSAVFIADETDGRATTCGLTVISDDGALASVQCMATWPAARRMGGARRVLAGIAAVAAQNGVSRLYLQTGADNAAARRLYESIGFAITSRYHTRTRRLA